MSNTSNKWYKALKYFLIPLAIVLVIYFLSSVLFESFSIKVPFFLNILKDHLSINNVYRLGDKFWPVTIKILFILLLLLLGLIAEVGFIRKENYGRYSLYCFLFLSFIALIFDFLFYMFPNQLFFSSLSNINLSNLETVIASRFMIRPFIASLIVYLLWGVVLALFAIAMFDTIGYLAKRDNLFTEDIVEDITSNKWTCNVCATENEGSYCKHCGVAKDYSERNSVMVKEEKNIELVMPEANKKPIQDDIKLQLEDITKEANEEINLSLNITPKKESEEIVMQIDENPFAKKIDEAINLEIEPQNEDGHVYCPRCNTKADGLNYCPHCGKKLK